MGGEGGGKSRGEVEKEQPRDGEDYLTGRNSRGGQEGGAEKRRVACGKEETRGAGRLREKKERRREAEMGKGGEKQTRREKEETTRGGDQGEVRRAGEFSRE